MEPTRTLLGIGDVPVKTTATATVKCARRFWDSIYVRLRLPMGQMISFLTEFNEPLFERLTTAVASGETFDVEYKTVWRRMRRVDDRLSEVEKFLVL